MQTAHWGWDNTAERKSSSHRYPALCMVALAFTSSTRQRCWGRQVDKEADIEMLQKNYAHERSATVMTPRMMLVTTACSTASLETAETTTTSNFEQKGLIYPSSSDRPVIPYCLGSANRQARGCTAGLQRAGTYLILM